MDSLYITPLLILITLLWGGVLWYLVSGQFKQDTGNIISSINALSRLDKVDSILDKSADDFVELFKFDYAVISTIDFMEKDRKIVSKSKASTLPESNLCHPSQWYSESIHELTYDERVESDILVEVVKRGHQAVAVRGIIVETDIKESALHEEIYKKYNHKHLARIYYPIVHRSKRQDNSRKKSQNDLYGKTQDDDIVLGVVECGYYLPRFSRFVLEPANTLDRRWAPDWLKSSTEYWMRRSFSGFAFSLYIVFRLYQKGLLTVKRVRAHGQLYADNLAQEYYRAYCREKSSDLHKRLSEAQFEEDLQKYADNTLQTITTYAGGDLGTISFKSLNFDYIHLGENTHYYPPEHRNLLDERLFKNRPQSTKGSRLAYGIVDKVCRDLIPYYTPKASDLDTDDPYYIHIYKSTVTIRSEIVLPILLDDYRDMIGIAIFSSANPNFFNAIHIAVIEPVLREFATVYNRKKRYHVFSVFTAKKFTNLQKLLYEVANTMHTYFNANHITIWQRDIHTYCEPDPDTGQRRSFFKLVNLQFPRQPDGAFYNNWRSLYDHYANLNALVQPFPTNEGPGEEQAVSITLAEQEQAPPLIQLYATQNIRFTITLKVKLLKKVEVVVQVFSKQSLTMIDTEDKQPSINHLMKKDQDFLTDFSQRVSDAIQDIYFLDAQNNIAEALFTENQSSNDILPKIAEQALLATRADSISFFPYQNRTILNSDAIRHGGLAAGYLTLINNTDVAGKPAKIANAIILAREDWNCWDNRDLYKDYFYSLPDTKIKIQNIDSNGFWYWNQIHSAAAFRLVYAGEPIGVMLFNYKEENVFAEHPDLKRLIMDFCRFAGIPLRNYQLTENLNKSIASFIENKNAYEEAQQQLQEEADKQQKQIDTLSELKIFAPFGTVASVVLHHSIGHILDNLVSSVKNVVSIDFIPRHGESQENFQESMADAEDSIAHARRLIKLFNRENFDWQPADLGTIITDEVNFLKPQLKNRQITIHTALGPDMPWIRIIKAEFSIVMYNLLQNAFEAIKRKALFADSGYFGLIDVQAQYDAKTKTVIVTVRDNGTGIKDETRQHMYELGFTTKMTGTGIGLYFVHEVIVNKYRGKLNLETKLNVGTTFELRIPERIKDTTEVLNYTPYLP